MASSPNLSSNNQFDKTKQYTQVVFQQGKPILDVDLNDMSNALQAQSTSALAEKMGYGAPQVDFREWAMTAVNTKDPDNARNEYNFAMTLGRLDTLKGVIDLHELRSSQLDSRIIFDYGRIEDNNLTDLADREFANYILKGTVTGSGSTTTEIHDEHKDFSPNHRLTAYQIQEVIEPTYSTVNPVANPTEERSTIDALVRVNEGACRLRLLATNEEREITGVANGQITVGTAFSQAPSAGDEYVILPPNTLVDYKNLYDSAVSQSRSKPEGLSNLPKLVTYVQVFEEDISSDEDLTIRSSVLGVETTHRTQLRWCIRVARLTTSIDGDTYNGNPVGNLKIEHINTLLNSNRLVQHHALADATDSTASLDEGALQTQYWRESDGTDINTVGKILEQESPYLELGLTPAHFFNSEEYTLDRLYWAFLKAFFIIKPVYPSTNIEFNDFVILNVFNSETKSNRDNASSEILNPIFYPGAYTNTTEATLTHAFLSVGNSFRRIADDTGAEPARFKSPPRVFHTQADLSVDNMKSRTLHGLRGGILYGANAPLVFSSPSSHFSFVDQMVLGMSGIGSAQGETSEGYRIPSAIDYTLANTTASLAQSGYDVGAIKMISPISASTISTGDTGSFLSGTASYLLREKGNRTSHTVNADDADLGWSLYKQEGGDLTTNNESDFSIRGWDEGIAQAIAFQQGINFRKLAIKTTAHKSMDLFTISETPRQQADQHDQNIVQLSSTAFQIPYLQSQEVNGNLFLDSYSGSAGAGDANMLPSNFIPANVSRFDPKPLLQQYQSEGGIKGFDQSEDADRDIAHTYGPWNRFDRADIADNNLLPASLDNADAPAYSMDMWGNRCTAMRLRYHVGDFYPGAEDSRGVPSNELVDSMNLFVKVEPLSLAHWMTMPKHQHSILENSISFAEGIEALLKVAHGLGDTQKLVNSSGQALVQETSPIRNNEFPLYPTAPSVGSVDPTNLPFEHHKQPFVHWYHPTMHKIKSPHPDGTNNGYDGSGLTVYPKFGRRSLIVPALVPSKFGTYTDGAGSEFPIMKDGNSSESYPELVGSDTASSVIGKTTVNVSAETGSLTISNSILPYPYHGSTPTATGETTIISDSGANITFRNNQITFPAVGTDGAEITPSPVFIPAGRSFASIPGTDGNARVGFNTLISYFKSSEWDDVTELDASFPYDERLTHYSPEAGGASNVPTNLNKDFFPFDVPVLKTAINTQTVSGIVQLVRTSFANGLGDITLSNDYDFTMPENVFTNYNEGTYTYNAQQVPAIGPDNPVDTLFVGDLGTALGGFSDRAGFISPLNFGVPMRIGVGLMPNGMIDGDSDIRDSFDYARFSYSFLGATPSILDTFNAISKMGLQQKLMWNCSFRVLHTRPGGMTSTEVSTAPKSITEVFLAHNRTDGNMTKTVFPAPSNAQKKPFIHLMSMHPQTNNLFPNKDHMEHLYPMVSDSTGGTHESTAITDGVYDYTQNVVKTSSMGDTFAVDPFDTLMNDHVFGSGQTLTKASENLEKNSGIEIDLISELNMIHENVGDYGLNAEPTVGSGSVPAISNTMPTANELTLPGDHELVFVLYTGHYGAKMFDTNDEVDISHIPPVAGCHLTATLEINRPSERISSPSATTDNQHYGKVITTYAIPSTRS